MSDNIGLYWTGGVLNAVSKLPYELQREVYNLIDYDTKLTVIMDRYPTMQRDSQRQADNEGELNDIFEWFTEKELSVIYRQGYLCKLFQYNERSRRWHLLPSFVNKLPYTTFYGYNQENIANVLGEPQHIEIAHPVYDMIDNLRRTQDIISVKTRLQLSISVLLHTDVRNEQFKRYLRKVAFQLILASNVYKRTCIKARQKREVEQQRLKLEREEIRIAKIAQRQIEIDEERRVLHAEKELERQRAAVERANLLRIREENKQLRQQEREQVKLEKEAQIIARKQEREENIQRKHILQKEKEEKRERANEQKIAQQKEKEEKRERANEQKIAQQKAKEAKQLFKLAQKTEKENKKREQTEQKQILQQLKLERNREKVKQKLQRANELAAKKKAIQLKQYEHTLCYISKLFL